MRFHSAIVRPPTANFADGLTKSLLPPPKFLLASLQHLRYCETLERCGLTLMRLPELPAHPDATFVEDTAIVTPRGAIVMRPGAESRRGEVESVRLALAAVTPALGAIEPPGTVDGGDVCEIGDFFLIGISERTDEEGARQLLTILRRNGYDGATVDIRGEPGLLHLKSGLAAVDEKTVVAVDVVAKRPEIARYDVVRVAAEEFYAANCIAVNGRVLVASGFPRLACALAENGRDVVTLDMSEFEKMDGGLSCLSLRI